jgi:hypothetical protein
MSLNLKLSEKLQPYNWYFEEVYHYRITTCSIIVEIINRHGPEISTEVVNAFAEIGKLRDNQHKFQLKLRDMESTILDNEILLKDSILSNLKARNFVKTLY